MAVPPTVRRVSAEGRRRSPMSHHGRPECFESIGLLCMVYPSLVPDRVGLILRARTTYPEYCCSRKTITRSVRPPDRHQAAVLTDRKGENNVNDADQPCLCVVLVTRPASPRFHCARARFHPYPPIHPKAGLRTWDLYDCHTAGHETPLLLSRR